jgi:NAD(P)-dependent dehydrogenase (short-subunit alcohol dehydrogenase family)
MIRVFVSGLHATVAAALALGGDRLVVWTPSTTMLDTRAPAAGASYCAAKAAMEELCRHLPAQFPVEVHAPRLGRVETDQTASLIQVPAASALDIALEQLKRLS